MAQLVVSIAVVKLGWVDTLVLVESGPMAAEERLVEEAAFAEGKRHVLGPTAGLEPGHVGNPGGKDLEPVDAEAAWGRRLELETNSVADHGFEAGPLFGHGFVPET